MNIVAIVQARTGSTRYPGKVFAPLAGRPLIWHIFNRLSQSRYINSFVLATTLSEGDDVLEEWASSEGIKCFRGSENNVLSRFYEAACKYQADIIIRVTADDPFKDPAITDAVIDLLIKKGLDFAHNNNPPSYPEGLDVEVFTMAALKTAFENADTPFEWEHMTQYFYRHAELFRMENISYHEDISHIRLTVDTKEDYEMAKLVFDELYSPGKIFQFEELIHFLNSKPAITKMNSGVVRSAMYSKHNT